MEEERHMIEGVYYKVKGDHRWHTDMPLLMELQKQIPNSRDDKCPACGNKENNGACRCPKNERFCGKCGVEWHWEIDKHNACIKLVIDKLPKVAYNHIKGE